MKKSLTSATSPQILDPKHTPFLSASALPASLNPFAEYGVEFVPIPLYSGLIPNMKAFVANSMLKQAQKDGKLNGVHTIVEATSGNTGAALGIGAPYYGVGRVVAVVKRDIAQGKLEQLRFFGVEPVFPDLSGEYATTLKKARHLGEQPGWLNLGQYDNKANPRAHELYTGPHVWKQTNGSISVFCAGLGTTGTVVGTSKFLRAKSLALHLPKITIVGVAVAPGSAVPGVRTEKELEQIGFDWRGAIDALEFVETKSAYRLSRQLCLEGRMVGPSSGFSFAGAIQFVGSKIRAGKLDDIKNKDGKVIVAFSCADTHYPYADKYSTILDPEDFLPLAPR